MSIAVGARPASLDGCWATWSEQDLDVLVATDMESGAVKTRRRFTGHSRMVKATVTLPVAQVAAFRTWYRVNQQQGVKGTRVMTPGGTEEVFQWIEPPTISININGTFTASVNMIQGSWF